MVRIIPDGVSLLILYTGFLNCQECFLCSNVIEIADMYVQALVVVQKYIQFFTIAF